jgi:integrase
MYLRDHDSEGRAVWLSNEEIETLLESARNQNQRMAFALGARCGLRSEEVTKVRPTDLQRTRVGPVLRIEEGKGDKFRQTPVPASLADKIETAAEYRDDPEDYPLVDSTSGDTGVSTRTLRRWIDDVAGELADTDDDQWRWLSFHDLRRSWATNVRAADVSAEIVMAWGGWTNIETFLDHYRDAYSPESQRREREKVAWL